jgi:hypothetical protein
VLMCCVYKNSRFLLLTFWWWCRCAANRHFQSHVQEPGMW